MPLSAMVTPRRTGGPSGEPVTLIAPPTAWRDEVERLVLRPRPARGVAAHRGDDQPRQLAQQLVDRQPEARQRAGGEVLRQHVGAAQQRVQVLAIGLGPEIEGDAALALVEEHEDDAVARRVAADQIAAGLAARRLDLDDVGAEPGEDLRRRRSGLVLGEIDDAHAGQRRVVSDADRSRHARHSSALGQPSVGTRHAVSEGRGGRIERDPPPPPAGHGMPCPLRTAQGGTRRKADQYDSAGEERDDRADRGS